MDKQEFLGHIKNYYKKQDLTLEYTGAIDDFKKLYLGLISVNPDEGVSIYNEVISEFMEKKYVYDRDGVAYFSQEGIEFLKAD